MIFFLDSSIKSKEICDYICITWVLKIFQYIKKISNTSAHTCIHVRLNEEFDIQYCFDVDDVALLNLIKINRVDYRHS